MKQILSPLISSSTDSTQVGNTVKGLILGASSIIIFLAFRFFHLNFTASDVSSLADELSLTAAAIWTVFGLIHKIVVFLGTKKSTGTGVNTTYSAQPMIVAQDPATAG